MYIYNIYHLPPGSANLAVIRYRELSGQMSVGVKIIGTDVRGVIYMMGWRMFCACEHGRSCVFYCRILDRGNA